jgi:hypothetical protein
MSDRDTNRPVVTVAPDQQPISRTVGKRIPRIGLPSDERARAAMTTMADYRTRAPKGVYIYDSAEAMQADRLRWTVDAMVANARER